MKKLLEDLLCLRREVTKEAERILEEYREFFEEGRASYSAINLAHYVALRRRDLCSLQMRLAEAGLSSLGRSESHVLANLGVVIRLLAKVVGENVDAAIADDNNVAFSKGRDLLAQNTAGLFGAPPADRSVRIMVTLPTEAAFDFSLVKGLLLRGMNCARINCAHDNETIWAKLFENIRRAERETGRKCKILMDLAGHKIRTGPIQPAPPVIHLKVKRDIYGQLVAPFHILLGKTGSIHAAQSPYGDVQRSDYRIIHIPDDFHQRLTLGDRMYFGDCRHKTRFFEVVEKASSDYWLCHGFSSTYLHAETQFSWRRANADGKFDVLGEFPLAPFSGKFSSIHVENGDHLLLIRGDELGSPAVYGVNGQIMTPARIGCSCDAVFSSLRTDQPVWIDDGKLGAVVESITDDGAMLKVTEAGQGGVVIRSDKGLNFPETEIDLPALSDKDEQDLGFVCRHADMVGFSFVRSPEDMACLMSELKRRGRPDLPIIAKIETKAAVDNLPWIILSTMTRHPLGIMIARGDLAVELGSVKMSEIQEEILWLCESSHVPVIWATQVLETLAKKGRSSRPEITDAAMSVRAECVMLNKGPYILDAVRVLGDILTRMDAHQYKKTPQLKALEW
ncbi:pyruvate kinase [Methylomicrobium sp. Wu6]|uniref:pyruvate kinase n=1 Tax=Methylomicrobium sp. Wu6 TaxID=3107928 RepID=UPI002DD63F70|nr:pyruvate kinase [Methylomicrobium sp. Wu6]MEC4747954.1 pyruvate kinase [Methylomicrobium sp. Wu6]